MKVHETDYHKIMLRNHSHNAQMFERKYMYSLHFERREYLRGRVESACDTQMPHKATENSLRESNLNFRGFA